MGRFHAHRVADLPPKTAAQVRHAMDVLDADAEFTDVDHAEAAALLAQQHDSPQRCLDLTPLPNSGKVYDSQFAAGDNKYGRGKGTP